MSKITRIGGIVGAAFLALAFAAPANAQATRTWISGVGDDVNPCSRTAPCKTFAGAISKTAAGGEIDVLDPGGFGAVTVTKSITLDGSGGSTAGILVTSTNGVNVNDSGAGTINVTIRNIDFEGFGFGTGGTGIRGISFISGASLNVQDCVIRNFRDGTNGAGISFTPSTAASLYVTNTTITGNGNTGVGGGIVVQPTGTGSAKVQIDNVRVFGNTNNGIFVSSTGLTGGTGNKVTISKSTFSGNGNGISVVVTAVSTIPSVVMVNETTVSNNSSVGVATNGGSLATLRIGGSTVSGNNFGVLQGGTSVLLSYGDNKVNGNSSNETFPGAPGSVIPKV